MFHDLVYRFMVCSRNASSRDASVTVECHCGAGAGAGPPASAKLCVRLRERLAKCASDASSGLTYRRAPRASTHGVRSQAGREAHGVATTRKTDECTRVGRTRHAGACTHAPTHLSGGLPCECAWPGAHLSERREALVLARGGPVHLAIEPRGGGGEALRRVAYLSPRALHAVLVARVGGHQLGGRRLGLERDPVGLRERRPRARRRREPPTHTRASADIGGRGAWLSSRPWRESHCARVWAARDGGGGWRRVWSAYALRGCDSAVWRRITGGADAP